MAGKIFSPNAKILSPLDWLPTVLESMLPAGGGSGLARPGGWASALVDICNGYKWDGFLLVLFHVYLGPELTCPDVDF